MAQRHFVVQKDRDSEPSTIFWRASEQWRASYSRLVAPNLLPLVLSEFSRSCPPVPACGHCGSLGGRLLPGASQVLRDRNPHEVRRREALRLTDLGQLAGVLGVQEYRGASHMYWVPTM